MCIATRLSIGDSSKISNSVTFGVCAAGDPRIDGDSRDRTVSIVEKIAGILALPCSRI